MGLAKYYEDNCEIIEERMMRKSENYTGCNYIYSAPVYVSYRAETSVQRKSKEKKVDLEVITLKYGYIRKSRYMNGIEIYFNTKPNEIIRSLLKANLWQWSKERKCWFNRYSDGDLKIARKILS